MLEEPSWLRDHESPYRAFAVTTMCRVFHALAHGTIVSKPRAIQWARQTLGDPWRQLIDQAAGSASHREVEVPLEETLNFIRFTRGAILKNEAAPK